MLINGTVGLFWSDCFLATYQVAEIQKNDGEVNLKTIGSSHSITTRSNYMEKEDTNKRSLWFVARTAAYLELKIRKYFEDHNIECFVPTRKETHEWKFRKIEVQIPVIRSLVFFRTDLASAECIFTQNGGILYRIFLGNDQLYVQDSQMESFVRFINDNDGKVEIWDSKYVTCAGVKIREVAFADTIGKIFQMNNRDYFTVSLDGLLIAAVEVSLSKTQAHSPESNE